MGRYDESCGGCGAEVDVTAFVSLGLDLLLVLFALGTNMGIKRVAVTGKHGESEAVLRRVRHLFVNRTNLRAALVRLVNATFAARDAAWWGEGTPARATPRSSAPGARTS
ncbi:transposase [Streptomyces sp. NBC_00467]